MINKICLIDDDDVLHFLFTALVKNHNIAKETQLFEDGEDAYLYLKENTQNPHELPDVIVLDINMPDMDGWDFLNHLTELQEELSKQPVIFLLSSSTHPKDKAKSTMYPAVSGYFEKPIDAEKLQLMLKELHS